MNNLLPNVPPTPFQQFQQLNGHLLNQPYNENDLRFYAQGVLANINLINRDRNVLLNAGHYSSTNQNLHNLNQELISYNNAKAELFRIVKGLRINIIPQGGSRGFSMNSERENFNNIRMIGGKLRLY